MKFFRSEKKKIRVTPEQLGEILVHTAAELAFDGDNSVASIIKRSESDTTVDDRAAVELMLFALFALDVIVSQQEGSHVGHVRQATRACFTKRAQAMARTLGGEPAEAEQYEAYIKTRFGEYINAASDWYAAHEAGEEDREATTIDFGKVAYRNITDSEDSNLQAQLTLVAFFSTVVANMSDALDEYEVVVA